MRKEEMLPFNQFPPPKQPTFSRALEAILTFVLVFAIILLAVLFWTGTIRIGMGMVNESQTCTVGVTGTAASIEFKGQYALQVCQAFYADSSGNYYQETEAPTAPELCEGDRTYQTTSGGEITVHFVVRDQGLFDLEGRAICQSLLSQHQDGP